MLDFKKDYKEQYQPNADPSVIELPRMTVIAIDGWGDPNKGAEYEAAIEALYALSYAIKMAKKAVLEYVVAPLEGFWDLAGRLDDGAPDGDAPITDKNAFTWTSFIRQPGFVDAAVFEQARVTVTKKKPGLDISKARLQTIDEGLCVQAMHIGPYDSESETIAALHQYAYENGYAIDQSSARRHYEIYLSDPRKIAPEKMKTVIRLPIARRA